MLNAFRHQRKSDADRTPCLTEKTGSCSTPFGIKGSQTSHGRISDRSRIVLNAFRHQRKSDRFTAECCDARKMCSTPFGIKGSQTCEALSLLYAGPRAQRLSASKEVRRKPPRLPRFCVKSAQRLSASKEVRLGSGSSLPTPLKSAQRLSASKEVRRET